MQLENASHEMAPCLELLTDELRSCRSSCGVRTLRQSRLEAGAQTRKLRQTPRRPSLSCSKASHSLLGMPWLAPRHLRLSLLHPLHLHTQLLNQQRLLMLPLKQRSRPSPRPNGADHPRAPTSLRCAKHVNIRQNLNARRGQRRIAPESSC